MAKSPTARQDLPFRSPYRHGFVRVAGCVPLTAVADPARNVDETLALVARGHDQGVALMLFPELGLSAYSSEDLFHQEALLDAVEAGIARLAAETRDLAPAFVVGAPLRLGVSLYNTAVVIQGGTILGIVPKSYLPNYREYYERRWFSPGLGVSGATVTLAGQTVPFGVDQIFDIRLFGEVAATFGVEVCEDLWTPEPPSTAAALAGAEILLNLSASNIVIGKSADRHLLCASQSLRCQAAYVYTAAGPGESTTDNAWDGQTMIFELGDSLAESERFPTSSGLTFADIDVPRLRQERRRTVTFGDTVAARPRPSFRRAGFDLSVLAGPMDLARPLERFPFVPSDTARLAEQCHEAYNIQVQGLAQRLKAARLDKLVIGVSGGLDSTQALLVAAKVMDSLGLPRTHVLAWTLPGFATSEGTRTNAWRLMTALGVTAAELDIRPAARQMLTDLGHPAGRGEAVHDVTFENVQAGLRTDYLFRLANQHRALVVGTGDLSELALGWCTYGVGDHMSHYNPNASVSKTLIQHLIRFVAGSGEVDAATGDVLRDVLATEISPELVPASHSGETQSTEAFVGPYALQDFNLHYLARFGFAPSRIAYLALEAWGAESRRTWPPQIPEKDRQTYDLPAIKRWLRLFLTRFFANQFKRSAVPNGPKISSGGALSPRGDWRMPSDASVEAWLAELDANTPDEA
ncbi:MAG: NAD(+) synthase [Caulobacter sp.]|nr:NAD(+) synthase [Caulobacter sp.]